MLTILSIFFVCMLILAGVLLVCSPGKVKPFLDERGKPLEGSISEKIHVKINGVEQGMFIKSKDSTNPVLLYLHQPVNQRNTQYQSKLFVSTRRFSFDK